VARPNSLFQPPPDYQAPPRQHCGPRDCGTPRNFLSNVTISTSPFSPRFLENFSELKDVTFTYFHAPSPGGVAQLVERVLNHSTRRAVPERSWVQSLLPTTEVEPGFSTLGGMLVPVLQLISPVCKAGISLLPTFMLVNAVAARQSNLHQFPRSD
jgi:hypothetical protein